MQLKIKRCAEDTVCSTCGKEMPAGKHWTLPRPKGLVLCHKCAKPHLLKAARPREEGLDRGDPLADADVS